MSAIGELFEAVVDWWQERQAESSRRELARLKSKDQWESVIFDLRIKAIDAETARLQAETKLVKARGKI